MQSPSNYSTPGYIVKAALRGFIEQGHDINALFNTSGIDPHILHNPHDRIESRQFAQLLRNAWYKMQDEYLGFGNAPSKLGTFATMCQSVLPCDNLTHALKRGARFYQLFESAPKISVKHINDQHVHIVLDTHNLNDPDNFLNICILVFIHRLCSWMTGSRVPLIRACFNIPDIGFSQDYQQFLASEIEFNADFTGLVLPAKVMALPLTQNEASLKAFLKNAPVDLVSKPLDLDSYSSQVRRVIGRDFSSTTPSLDEVAEQLFTTTQTLHRRLKQEGTSFKEIKENLRRDLAIHYLNTSDLSIQEISENLGFAETSNFHRAFKKWTGSTPRGYRLG